MLTGRPFWCTHPPSPFLFWTTCLINHESIELVFFFFFDNFDTVLDNLWYVKDF